jgi:hypothetical protein
MVGAAGAGCVYTPASYHKVMTSWCVRTGRLGQRVHSQLPVHHLALLHGHHVDTIGLHLSDAIWVLVVNIASKEVVHGSTMQTLSLRYWAILVSKEERLEVNNFLAKLSDGSRESIVLCAEELNLGLEVGKPLLLALSALEGSNPNLR